MPPTSSPPPPPTWERLLDTLLEAPLQRAGRPLTVLLRSHVSLNVSSGQRWTAAMSGPGNQTNTQSLGLMSGPVAASTTPAEYQWNVTVPGEQMTAAGTYTLFVFYNGSLSTAPSVTGNGSTVTIYPGPPDSSMCGLQVTPLANTTTVGDPVGIDLTLRDAYGNPALAARNVSVSLIGPVSKRTIVAGSNFTRLGAVGSPGSSTGSSSSSGGLFRYVHFLEAREQLTVVLNVKGAAVANATLNVSAVMPAAIAFNASLGKAVIQLYGTTEFLPVMQLQAASLQAAALLGHRLEVPVVRASNSAEGFGTDPGLLASLELSSQTGMDVVYNGSWYGGNRSYVIFFRAPAVGLYRATIRLQHPAVETPQASLTLRLNATLPHAVNFSLYVEAASRSRVGDWVYVTPTLLDELGQPAEAPGGLTLTARGAFSGNTSLPLQISPDGIRFLGVQYTFRIQETVVFELAVGTTVVANSTVIAQGVAPALLDLPRSLSAACMVNVVGGAAPGAAGSCSATAESSAVVRPDVTRMVQKGSQATLEMPVYTVDGQVWQSDPGLSVVLSLVPSALVDDVNAAYASSLSATLRRMLILAAQEGGDDDYGTPGGDELGSQGVRRRARRELLQQYGSAYSGTQAYDDISYTGEYAADNAAGAGYDLSAYDMGEEPHSPWASDNFTLPAPPLNVDSPDGVSPLQDQLVREPQVISVRGNFSTYKLSYQLPLLLTDSETYLALLSVRNPAMAGSLRLTRFWVTTMDLAKLSSVAGTNSSSTAAASFNPTINPVVSLNLTLPAAAVTSYPGGPETMLADYRALLASRAGLSSTDNVVVSLTTNISGSGSSNGSGAVVLAFQVYFDANWASTPSSFASMTSLAWFYFRLENLPATILQDKAMYPALDATVVQVTAVSLDEQSAAALAASATTSDMGGATTQLTPIILSSDIDSDPVATLPASATAVALPAAIVSAPPVLTMLGEPYMEVLELETFTDPGVYVYDAVDGFELQALVTVRLCARKSNLEAMMYAVDAAAAAASAVGTPASNETSVAAAAAAAAQVAPPSIFTCPGGNTSTSGLLTTYPNGALTLNSSAINAVTQMYLLTYSAVNSRAAAAAPRYRAVVVKQRCKTADGEFWCAATSACSVGGVCSTDLAGVSKALQSITDSASASSTAVASAVSAAMPDLDPSTLTIITAPDGSVVVISPDGRSTVIDLLEYTRLSWAGSGSESYGILGDIMATDAGALTAAASAQQPVYAMDTLPPVITLLGSGQPALTRSGIAVMIDRVEVGWVWTDPGATVWDAVDGNLTALLQAYGAAAVDTSRPTKPGSLYSYMVDYQAADLTGNLAQPARRLIRLVCPANERYCIDADDLPACTTNGVCGEPLATSAYSPGSTSSSTATTGSGLPRLTLVGPSEVRIQQYTQYDRCTTLVPQDQPCEPGAVAADPRDGSLDLRIQVCGVPLRSTRAGQTLLPLLLACNASTATPGKYTITYSVANSAGRSVSVLRTLIVLAVCPNGERPCEDGISCSESGGICAGDLQIASLSAYMAAATVSTDSATALKPQITLVTAAAAPAIVRLPRGSTYAPCAAGADLSAASTPFCEPGATVVDSTGAVNLTDRVVVCPPSNCLYRTARSGSGGCSSDLLRRHTLAAKGLAGCGLNTLAPPGAVFHIDFWVWDDARPPYNATARRTIVITDPCTDDAAPYFCFDGAGDYLCSPSPCAATTTFVPPAAPGPSITLLPSADVAYVEYGTASPVYLGPCASVSDTHSCGAAASGILLPTSPAGSATTTDLTAQLTVINTTPCNMTANGNAACTSCSLEALAVGSGSCSPGVYTFRYSVTDDQGMTATADRTVVVYQEAIVTASLTLLTGQLTDANAAIQLTVNVLNSSHPDRASAVQEIVVRMAKYGVQASDVDILSAAVSPASPPPTETLPASMLVNVAVHLYNPRSVHRAATGTGLALSASSSRRRRQLRSGGDGPVAPPVLRSLDAEHSSQADDWATEGEVPVQGLAGVWEVLAQRRVSELQQRRRLLLQQLQQQLPDPLDQTCRQVEDTEGRELRLGSTDGLGGHRQGLRTLLQTSTNGTISTNTLGSLAASVASSLNATSVDITTPATPDLTAGYMESIVGLAKALVLMSDATFTDADALSISIPLTMGDTSSTADEERGAAIKSAVSALLADAADAENRTLAYAAQVASGLDAELAAVQQVLAQAGELDVELRELSALTRAQTDRALYVAMVAAASAADIAAMVMDPDCYRLQLTGFRAAFNLSRFAQASSGPSSSAGASSSPADVGGRRRLGSSRGDVSASRSSSFLPWMGYVVTRGASTQDALLGLAELDVGADLRVAVARPRYAGVRIQNRVVGGLLLHTTRRAMRPPSDVGSTAAASSEASCRGGFSGLDASCHWYDVAFLQGGSTASSYLKRLFAGTNSSLAPYGVDPVFLRSSALYREDLASQLGWYYNTSDPAQVSATGTPYGFSPRPLRGRTPGFPVLLESGLSASRAAAMVRYLADGNYLDHRQTVDMSAEMLVYNPGLHAFAYFRGDFGWSEAGSISGRLSAVGFPAMAYLKEGEPLSAGLNEVFARELLPLWALAVFFAVVTAFATVNAAARAARWAAAVAAAAAHERALTYALKAFEAPLTQNPVGGVAAGGGAAEGAKGSPAARPVAFAALVAGATGTVPWANAGAADDQGSAPLAGGGANALVGAFGGGGGGAAASHIRILRDEVAARREERLEFLGASGFSERRAGFREFVRRDGGLLYDIPLALLLLAVAAFWTAFVELHLVLYDGRAFYRVYDASASSSANWLLAARSDPSSSATVSASVVSQAATMGIDVPSSAGDPGRWLLPKDDSDWDALNQVLRSAHSLVNMWTTYGMLQAVVIVGLIAKLVVVMAFQARLGIICRTLMTMFTPIAHLLVIIVVVVVMVAAAANTVLGDHVAALSSMAAAIGDTMKTILGPVAVDDVDMLSKGLMVPTVQRFAAAAVLLTKILLLLWVLFAFFFAAMSHIFMKQKHSVDWARASTVPQDLARVVLPDLLRRAAALLPGAAARRRRRSRRQSAASAKGGADGGTDDDADAEAAAGTGGCAPGCCDDLAGVPTNTQLLRSLAAGGVHELMCASELPKTWNGRVRVAKVARGRLLIDKATMRQLMGTVAAKAAATAAKLPRCDDDDGEGGVVAKGGGAAARALTHREMALTVARRVMDRVGRTYGSKTPEYQTLERAAEAEAAARRRSMTSPGGGLQVQMSVPAAGKDGGEGSGGGEQRSSGSMSPPRRSLSTEIAIHMSIYDALRAAVESIVRWQSGVHRWQVRTWKQMASAYLFNQQLMAGLGVAPGPAFVERPRALQDDDLPQPQPRDSSQRHSQTQLPPSPFVSPPLALPPLPLPLQGSLASRVSWMGEDGPSGLLSPSQLSVNMSLRGRASDGHLSVDNGRWASRSSFTGLPGLPAAVRLPTPPSQQQHQLQQQLQRQLQSARVQSPNGQQRQAASLEEAGGQASGSPGEQVAGAGASAGVDAASPAAAAVGMLAAARRSLTPPGHGAAVAPMPAPAAARPESPSHWAADAGSSQRSGSRSLSGPPGGGAGLASSPSGNIVALRAPSRWMHMPPALDAGGSPAGGPSFGVLPPVAQVRGQSFAVVPEEEPSSPEMDPDSGNIDGLRAASDVIAAAAAPSPLGLPSARHRPRWGGVTPMVDEMRERLTALMHRRSGRTPGSGRVGHQSGSGAVSTPTSSSGAISPVATAGSNGGGGCGSGPNSASSTAGAAGGGGGSRRLREPDMVYNIAYGKGRRSVGGLADAVEEEEEEQWQQQQWQQSRRPSV